jgi:hypothetical protein
MSSLFDLLPQFCFYSSLPTFTKIRLITVRITFLYLRCRKILLVSCYCLHQHTKSDKTMNGDLDDLFHPRPSKVLRVSSCSSMTEHDNSDSNDRELVAEVDIPEVYNRHSMDSHWLLYHSIPNYEGSDWSEYSDLNPSLIEFPEITEHSGADSFITNETEADTIMKTASNEEQSHGSNKDTFTSNSSSRSTSPICNSPAFHNFLNNEVGNNALPGDIFSRALGVSHQSEVCSPETLESVKTALRTSNKIINVMEKQFGKETVDANLCVRMLIDLYIGASNILRIANYMPCFDSYAGPSY